MDMRGEKQPRTVVRHERQPPILGGWSFLTREFFGCIAIAPENCFLTYTASSRQLGREISFQYVSLFEKKRR